MDTNLIVLLVLASGLAILIARALPSWRPGSKNPEAELFRLCNADKELKERLLRHELSKDPKINRREAARRAAYRLRRDQ